MQRKTLLVKRKMFFLLAILNFVLEMVLEGKKEIVLWYTISILKSRKRKNTPNFTNPDPWARIVGSRNTAAIYTDGKATTALYDSGAELQLISKEFCEGNNLEIHPIEKLTDCTTMNGSLLGYDGYVGVNVQIPGRDFSEDHLFLVTSEISHQKKSQL